MPVLPCTSARAMGKSNEDHCPVLKLHCLWTNQANTFKGMSLNSLLDWIQAVGPVPSAPTILLRLGVSGHLPWTSMLVAVGRQGFRAPAA